MDAVDETLTPAPPGSGWPPPPSAPPPGPASAGPGPEPPAAVGRRYRWTKVAAVVGVVTGSAVGAAVLAAAASDPAAPDVTTAASSSGSGSTGSGSGSSSGAPSSQLPPGPGGFPGGHRRFGGPGFFGSGLLYGEFTVNGPNGYETLQVQNGTVSSIKNTSGTTWSLVVKSADGTSYTYVVDSGTSVDGGETGVSGIASGDNVRVLAVMSGGTATAKQVEDQTVLQHNGEDWAPSPPASPGSSSPSGSGTSG